MDGMDGGEYRKSFRKTYRKNHKKVGRKISGKMYVTAWYSTLHMLVDGACALAMFGKFIQEENGYFYILLYNFCAFALQMPLGVILDALNERGMGKRDYDLVTVTAGVLCTVLGAVIHPVVLGIGNALFHVGGGVGVIEEDMATKSWHGRGLGIFVAPGALGLYLGTLIAKNGAWKAGFCCVSIIMVLLCVVIKCLQMRYKKQTSVNCCTEAESREAGLYESREAYESQKVDWYKGREADKYESQESSRYVRKEADWIEYREADWYGCQEAGQYEGKEAGCYEGREAGGAGCKGGKAGVVPALCCMAVVILRSYIGMTVGFSWKTGMIAGIFAVLALVGGKVAGGFVEAKWGMCKTAVISLGLAAACYLFSSAMPVGLAAIFLFNMTMPITLYLLVCQMPDSPGFAFGFLTFALFLGFLPGYFGLVLAIDGRVAGSVGSILSLILLVAGMGRRHQW